MMLCFMLCSMKQSIMCSMLFRVACCFVFYTRTRARTGGEGRREGGPGVVEEADGSVSILQGRVGARGPGPVLEVEEGKGVLQHAHVRGKRRLLLHRNALGRPVVS
jgi:hypothetical protein